MHFSYDKEVNFRTGVLALALALPVLCVDAPNTVTVQRMLTLFDHLRQAEFARAEGRPASRVKFDLPQGEVNTYLAETLRTTPRPGFKSMTVKFFPANYISSFTLVDFDEVERARPGLIPKLLRTVLTGQKTVWIDIRFRVLDGKVTFDVEKALFQNTPIPAVVVQKVIEVVASRQPEHYDTSKPIPLPFGLRTLSTQAGLISGEN